MTVGATGEGVGSLQTVISEEAAAEGEITVKVCEQTGTIHADLTIGADIVSASSLLANQALCFEGVKPHGMGFVVSSEIALTLGLGRVPGLELLIRDYCNGRDLTDVPREMKIVDLYGLNADEVRTKHPRIFQYVLDSVVTR